MKSHKQRRPGRVPHAMQKQHDTVKKQKQKKHTSQYNCKATRTDKKTTRLRTPHARPNATVALLGWWRPLSAVHPSGTTPAESRCDVAGPARKSGHCHTKGDSQHTSCHPCHPFSQDKTDGKTYCSKLPPQTKISFSSFCLILRPTQGRPARHNNHPTLTTCKGCLRPQLLSRP